MRISSGCWGVVLGTAVALILPSPAITQELTRPQPFRSAFPFSVTAGYAQLRIGELRVAPDRTAQATSVGLEIRALSLLTDRRRWGPVLHDRVFGGVQVGHLRSAPRTYYGRPEQIYSVPYLLGYELLPGLRLSVVSLYGGIRLQWSAPEIGSSYLASGATPLAGR